MATNEAGRRAVALLRRWLERWDAELRHLEANMPGEPATVRAWKTEGRPRLERVVRDTRDFLDELDKPPHDRAPCPACGQEVRVITFEPERFEPHAVGTEWCTLSGKEVRSCSA